MSDIRETSASLFERETNEKFRILGVDNRPDISESMQRIAELADPHIIFTPMADYQSALSAIPHIHPHLILTDYQQEGEINGITFAQAVKVKYPDTMIALVTVGVEESLLKLANRGERFIDFFIHKEDFSVEKVLSIMEAVKKREALIRHQR
ncbi:hypothetical protein BH11PAT1_BH11PAT1_1030 [soil metagenome]